MEEDELSAEEIASLDRLEAILDRFLARSSLPLWPLEIHNRSRLVTSSAISPALSAPILPDQMQTVSLQSIDKLQPLTDSHCLTDDDFVEDSIAEASRDERLPAKPFRKLTPFGDARPREIVLQARGIDWQKLDMEMAQTVDFNRKFHQWSNLIPLPSPDASPISVSNTKFFDQSDRRAAIALEEDTEDGLMEHGADAVKSSESSDLLTSENVPHNAPSTSPTIPEILGMRRLLPDHYGNEAFARSLQKDSRVDDISLLAENSDDTSFIDISYSDDTISGLILLKDSVNLQSLSFNYCDQISNHGLEHVSGLSKLTSLSLQKSNSISAEGMKVVTNLVSLVSLDLQRYLGIHGGLINLQCLTKLETLNLSYYNCITDGDITYPSGLTNFIELQMSRCKVSDEGVAHLKGPSKLDHITLEGCPITTACLQIILGFVSLLSLHLSRCGLSDSGCEKFADLVKLKVLNLGLLQLKSLELSDAEIGSSVLRHLSGLCNLENFNLSFTLVADSGLRKLSGLPSLKSLNLNACQITDACISALTSLPGLPHLDLFGARITTIEVAKEWRVHYSQKMLECLLQRGIGICLFNVYAPCGQGASEGGGIDTNLLRINQNQLNRLKPLNWLETHLANELHRLGSTVRTIDGNEHPGSFCNKFC